MSQVSCLFQRTVTCFHKQERWNHIQNLSWRTMGLCCHGNRRLGEQCWFVQGIHTPWSCRLFTCAHPSTPLLQCHFAISLFNLFKKVSFYSPWICLNIVSGTIKDKYKQYLFTNVYKDLKGCFLWCTVHLNLDFSHLADEFNPKRLTRTI